MAEDMSGDPGLTCGVMLLVLRLTLPRHIRARVDP